MIVTDPLISAGYGGWWRNTLALVARTWPQLLALQAVAGAVTLTVDLTERQLGTPFGFELAAGALDMVVSGLVTLTVVHLLVFTAVDRPRSLRDCVRGSAPAVLPLLGWTILCIPLVVLGFLVFVLPGIFALLVFTLLAPVVAVERGGEIRRCLDLFDRSWKAATARTGTIILITGVVGAAGVQLASSGGVRELVLADLAVAFAGLVTGPLTVTAYADMRAQGEPVTAESIAQQLQNR